MEIIRSQPFPLSFSAEGFSPEEDYVICILDDHAGDLSEISVTSDSDGIIDTALPEFYSRYDDEYRVEIYEKTGENENGSAVRGDLVYVDTLSIMRPYVDPRTLVESEEDVEEMQQYESIARAIINAITGGFMYQRQTVETVGLGNDYLSVPFRLNKIVRVYENSVLVYDANPSDPETWTNIKEYFITPDRGAITMYVDAPFGFNRMQSKPTVVQMPASDSFTLYNTNDSPNIIQNKSGSPMFPSDWDYVVEVEVGWPIIPYDIKQATQLLIKDLRCNNIPYMNAYIREYESDQFNLKFERDIFISDKTGNRIVDRILSAYVRPIYRLGVL
jgi:hypothetical protein